MKLILKILLVVFLQLLSNYAFAEQIRLDKSTFKEFCRIVSDYLDKPIILNQDLDKPFSINAKFETKEQLKQLFKNSLLAYGLGYDEDDMSITVLSSHNLKNNFLNYKPDKIQADIQKPLPTFVIVYPLKNISSSHLIDSFSKNAGQFSVIDSPSNNSLVVTATKDQHKTIKQLISALDVPIRQVLIEAVISEVSDKDYAGLDAKLENYRRLDTSIDSLSTYSVSNPFVSLAQFGMKLLSSKSLRFFLDWVKTSDSSTVLAKPKIVTLNRKEASIIVGQNVPFITGKSTSQASDTNTPFQTIERQDVGLKLIVTPVILPNGLIQLSVNQESSSVSGDTAASDIITNKRAITSTAYLKDGETLLLGGLSSLDTSLGHTQMVPDSIPIIDWFFSGDKQSSVNTNLVVLISVSIIKDKV